EPGGIGRDRLDSAAGRRRRPGCTTRCQPDERPRKGSNTLL
ncbi:MAG: hypothetical protein AVDCRST_MAG19-3913, partial [uncultured Thermomicrobiales bacterium]